MLPKNTLCMHSYFFLQTEYLYFTDMPIFYFLVWLLIFVEVQMKYVPIVALVYEETAIVIKPDM